MDQPAHPILILPTDVRPMAVPALRTRAVSGPGRERAAKPRLGSVDQQAGLAQRSLHLGLVAWLQPGQRQADMATDAAKPRQRPLHRDRVGLAEQVAVQRTQPQLY